MRRFARLRVTESRLFITPIDRAPFVLDVDETEWLTVDSTVGSLTRFGIAEVRPCITSVDATIDWHTPLTQVHSFL